MNKRKYFGTDGIRGRVGEAPINPEFILKLGWAFGRVIMARGGKKVLIGKDTRISGYLFESALQAGLSAAGVDIGLMGPMPTPAIAYLTRTLRADAGIVISASHNPYYDNGIKFFSGQGTKLPDELELAIEAQLEEPLMTVDSAHLGKATRIDDAAGRYIEFCKSTVPAYTSLKGFKVVLDCANGATYHVAPDVFRELGAEVSVIHHAPNGLNINAQCGATDPRTLQQRVLAESADLGIAFDGDGDRVVIVDHQGEVLNGDELVYVIAAQGKRNKTFSGGVVGTVMSNLGLERGLQQLGIDFIRVPVGDRHIISALKEQQWLLGGEASGHIIWLPATTTGDGIVAALQVLAAMQQSNNSLHELKSGMVKLPQTLINVKLTAPLADNYLNSSAIKAAIKTAEETLNGRGRILLRGSGTEPVLRIMVEGDKKPEVDAVAEALAQAVTASL